MSNEENEIEGEPTEDTGGTSLGQRLLHLVQKRRDYLYVAVVAAGIVFFLQYESKTQQYINQAKDTIKELRREVREITDNARRFKENQEKIAQDLKTRVDQLNALNQDYQDQVQERNAIIDTLAEEMRRALAMPSVDSIAVLSDEEIDAILNFDQ